MGQTIRSVPVRELRDLGFDVEVVIVDNGSTDGTATVARSCGATVVREAARGYGNACRTGFRAARGDVMVMLDADGTYPVEDIPRFVRPLASGEAEFVIGTRLRGEIEPGAMPVLHRFLGDPILTFVLNVLFRVGVSDGHCGMRAFSRAALSALALRSPGFEQATEMLIDVKRCHLRIQELPITYRRRRGTPSKLRSFRDGWRHLMLMVRAFAVSRRLQGTSGYVPATAPEAYRSEHVSPESARN